MADTKRSSSDLLTTLFQDGQAAGSISPQDVRDLLVSLMPVYGACNLSSSAVTTIATISTPIKAAGVTALGSAVDMDDDGGTSNRLKYLGSITRIFNIIACTSMTSVGGGDQVALYIYKNGLPITGSEVLRTTASTGSDHGAASVNAMVSMTNGDYVELWVANNSNNNNVTITKLQMTAQGYLV